MAMTVNQDVFNSSKHTEEKSLAIFNPGNFYQLMTLILIIHWLEDKHRSQDCHFSDSFLPLTSTESWAHPNMLNKRSLTDILRLWKLIKCLWSTLEPWREVTVTIKCHLLNTKLQLPVRLANPVITILWCLNTANHQWVNKVHVFNELV